MSATAIPKPPPVVHIPDSSNTVDVRVIDTCVLIFVAQESRQLGLMKSK